MPETNYPGILVRVKAIVTDGIVLIAFMFVTTYVFSFFETVLDIARIIAFVFIFLLYDPILISFFGGTIGHMINGLQVKRESNEKKNVLFPLALLRYIVKFLLGWISLLTVSGNKKGKAIHDYLVGSVVVYSRSKEVIKTNENTAYTQ
ncbi:MAG: RDD family protein [Saprospiraceae bacterium]|nr:RDD family protein [Saprospiraceae bacterium]MBK7809806.1 RDD family protein [Saprospiraceae bacterium]MBK9632082.1 RDD family protein [Saprospiraceae bacterium]